MSNWFSNEWNALKAWFANIAPKVLAFLKPVAQQVTEDEIAIAEASVSVGFATSGDNLAKMGAALSYFSAQSVAKEIPFIESKARALIEIALQNVKASATQVAATGNVPAVAVLAIAAPV